LPPPGARREIRELQARAQGKRREGKLFARSHHRHRRGRREAVSPFHEASPHADGSHPDTGEHQCQLHLHTDIDVTLTSPSSPKSSAASRGAQALQVPLASIHTRLGHGDDALRLPPHSIEAEQASSAG